MKVVKIGCLFSCSLLGADENWLFRMHYPLWNIRPSGAPPPTILSLIIFLNFLVCCDYGYPQIKHRFFFFWLVICLRNDQVGSLGMIVYVGRNN